MTNSVQAHTLNNELSRQLELVRGLEEPHEPYGGGLDRRPYFGGVENAPVSPRQFPQDDTRRSSLAVPQPRGPYDYRPQVPSNLSISTKRPYGSIGGSSSANQNSTPTTQSSPSTLRPAPPPPPGPHPSSAAESPPNSLLRRHTSADIRVHENWRPQQPPPFASGPPSSHLPSSPSPLGPPDDRLRESLSQYSFPPTHHPYPQSRPPSPPPTQAPMFSNGGETFKQLNNFQWDRAQERRSIFQHDSSAPPTRRGSMAHILNHTDDDSDPRGDDDRKRRRV